MQSLKVIGVMPQGTTLSTVVSDRTSFCSVRKYMLTEAAQVTIDLSKTAPACFGMPSGERPSFHGSISKGQEGSSSVT